MNCDKTIDEVYRFLDGELGSVRRSRIEWHLRKCDGCHDAYAFEERLLLLVKRSCSAENTEIPPELFDRLRALIHQETTEGASDE